MRELAFRAWHKEYGMIHPNENFSLANAVNGDIEFFGSPAKDFATDDFTFMQYIGIKDKNGVEIYEADILESPRVMGKSYRYVVTWNDGKKGCLSTEVGWLLKNDVYSYPLEVYYSPYEANSGEYVLETVIGNIYQNPELIKEVK